MRRTHWAILLAAGVAATQSFGEVTVSPVALTGQQVPGAAVGVRYQAFFSPVIDDDGRVAFLSVLGGAGVGPTNDRALVAGLPRQLSIVAREGDPAPGTSAGETLQELIANTPALNDVGEIGYVARFSPVGSTTFNDMALYAGLIAEPALRARSRTPAPDLPAGVNYSGFDAPWLTSTGRFAFTATLAGAGVGNENSQAIFAGTLDAPRLVARNGTPAPQVPPGVEYSFVGGPVLSDAGQVVYAAGLRGSGVEGTNDQALYGGSPQTPQLIMRRGDAAPGTPAGVRWGTPFFQTLNQAGAVVFRTSLTDAGGAFHTGIAAGPISSPTVVAREGDPAPDAPTDVLYGGMNSAAALNNEGAIAFQSLLQGSGVTFANNNAIFAGTPGALRMVARSGEAAPGFVGANLSALNVPALNDGGQLAYRAFLSGPGINSANDGVLYLYDPDLGAMPLVREGMTINVDGVFRTVAGDGINFLTFGASSTGFNKLGTAAVTLVFTDGSAGVFALSIPEPATGLLLAAFGLLRRRR